MQDTLPADYIERVYAAVLGKIIGVYLGRPVEQWSHRKIADTFGEVDYYIHEKRNVPLVVADDDISGTFTFLRAMPDHGNDVNLTAGQIGQAWLNYIIEHRTVLWWGGTGVSTEHTAYLNLIRGIPAPQSGSVEQNGRAVAEEIGAQIFIDGWALISPGNPAQAVSLAGRAASVSHDGEAKIGAQFWAALEAQAFVETDLQKLIETGLEHIPGKSHVARMVNDVRAWHKAEPDWRKTLARILDQYGYQHFETNCPLISNQAIMILALLYGDGDFSRSLMIVTTAGYDTDCNAGNLGCLLGIRNGLPGLEADARDWRGPVADRIYLPTADGDRGITDAVRETYEIVNIGRALQGREALKPKNDAYFHFELPGSVQGFLVEPARSNQVKLRNVAGHSSTGKRSLEIAYRDLDASAQISSATFLPPELFASEGYGVMACPKLYPTQTVRASVQADEKNGSPVQVRLVANAHEDKDRQIPLQGESVSLAPGETRMLEWTVPDTGGHPIFDAGLKMEPGSVATGVLYLDYLTWSGTPRLSLRPAKTPRNEKNPWWEKCWVNSVDHFHRDWLAPIALSHAGRRGQISIGSRLWKDYEVAISLRLRNAREGGIGLHVGGLRQYYAFLLRRPGNVQIVKMVDEETILASADFALELERTYELTFAIYGSQLTASIDGWQVLAASDTDPRLPSGGMSLLISDGLAMFGEGEVRPFDDQATSRIQP